MNRICFFAHYDIDNLIEEYVLYFLKHLKTVCNSIIFVTTSKICKNDITRLEALCNTVITRENIGYDFVSWQTGMKSIANIADLDQIIICNDSVYGPLFPLSNIFDIMDKKGCDFWGMTDNHEIAYHLQSYFLVFNRRVIYSATFRNFWNSVQVEKTKQEIIRKYEVGLTQSLMCAGFKPYVYSSYYPSLLKSIKVKAISILKKSPSEIFRKFCVLLKKGQLNYKEANPAHFYWKDLIVKYKMPFLKIELIRDNPLNINIKGYEDIIRNHSHYNLDLIRKHLKRISRRNI